jgi:membrane protease YdiL (CAAX protease family)
MKEPRDVPPGFGRWPWWTPVAALAAALLLLGGPLALLRAVDVPLELTIAEGLFGVALLGCAYALAARFGSRPSRVELGFRAAPARASVGWVLLARIGYVIVATIYVLAVGGVTPNVPVRPLAGVSTFSAVDLVIAVVVLAPLVEEAFFRGFMYAALRGRMPVFPAALICGGLFAAVHPIYGDTQWNLVPVLAIAGVAACLLYEKTGSLWPPIAFHALMNIGVLALVTGSYVLPLAIVGGAALLFLLAPWRLVRRRGDRRDEDRPGFWSAPPPPPTSPRLARLR